MQVTQELRNISRVYNVPVITATQNSKVAENISNSMDNTMMGKILLI